jgi:GGDEF domain-containing protein
VLAPAGLLALLARERRSRIERAQAFQHAYDGAHLEARRDALTGLANRLAWQEAAVGETARPASVVVLDVDCLKLANDTRGHEFGDEVLRRVAALARNAVREQDLVARVGGDEIAILLGGADAFASAPSLDGFPLSAALGAATAAAGLALADAQRLADERLYAEKAPSSRRGGVARRAVAQSAPA